jgi:esterase/lipase superfamily enzyme
MAFPSLRQSHGASRLRDGLCALNATFALRLCAGVLCLMTLAAGIAAADETRAAAQATPAACTADNPTVWLEPPRSGGGRVFLRIGQPGFGQGSGKFVCERYAASLGALAITTRPIVHRAFKPKPVSLAPTAPAPLPSPRPNFAVVRVYFATDRQALATAGTTAQFGSERGSTLQYGYSDVEVPNDHHPTAQSFYDTIVSVIFHPDAKRQMKIDSAVVESGTTFDETLRDAVGHSANRQALVFIHGFNVSWNQAIMTTADLAFDLGPTFDGPAISYSWPSRGDTALYTYDQQNAAYTAPHLATFLEEVATKSGATTIHVIAHSMGGYALSLALVYAASHSLPSLKGIHDISLAAPDIDADIFAQQYASMYQQTSKILTVYTSSVDYAMQASRRVNGAGRLGDSNSLTLVPGFAVVDATDIDTDFLGHGYFEDQLSMITDFGLTFMGLPEPHPPLQVRTMGNRQYYAFP